MATSETGSTSAVAAPPDSKDQRIPQEDIRFAVVLNGGVSLAVWMGGAVLEIDRLTRREGPYGPLLDVVGSDARADVIAGTSAGGINGAALALAQINSTADLALLRDLWANQADIAELMQRPFQGSPVSLLRGDDYFLPQLVKAFDQLVTPYRPRSAQDRPIDLTITTTLLRGAPTQTIDAMGQMLQQSIHAGRFHFRRDTGDSVPPGEDASRDFSPRNITATVARLALAARCTAAFPFAFEPSFVPVSPDGAGIDGLHPNMRDVASWRAQPTEASVDRSRFTVDGGLLANTPTLEALRAVDRMPAANPVKRVMLLVYPHATVDLTDKPDKPEDVPTLLDTSALLLRALSSQGSRTFVERIDEHNRAAAARRASRADLLASMPADRPLPEALHDTAEALYPHYRPLRIRRAARDLAARVHATPGWTYDRIRSSAEKAQHRWGDVPYLPPSETPLRAAREFPDGDGPHGWAWGVSTAEHLAESALDLSGRLVRAVKGPAGDDVCAKRKELFTVRTALRSLRDVVDRPWRDDQQLATLEPNEDYWRRRLAAYAYAMLPGTPPPENATAPITAAGEIGDGVRAQVLKIAEIVTALLPNLRDLDDDRAGPEGLGPWQDLFAGGPVGGDAEAGLGGADRTRVVIARLLSLEIITACLAEETATEVVQPIELVQVSLETRNPFARFSRTPSDKGAGLALSRFAGFLKQSWRVNDWIWGRMDTATTLCRILMSPSRLRQIAILDGSIENENLTSLDIAKGTVDRLLTAFGCEPAGGRLGDLVTQSVLELEKIYRKDPPAEGIPPSIPEVADLAAWAVHARIASEELPALDKAVAADVNDGGARHSRGELFRMTNQRLVTSIKEAPRAVGDYGSTDRQAALSRGLEALEAFDRALIGTERLAEEAGGDRMIRTSVEAACVAVTVLDSARSGLPIRPVTRALRGAALLPYWAIRGMTGGGKVAQFLGVLGLSLGGMLTVLALLGTLPAWASGPAAAIGVGALLATFAYGAVRTGSMLHGIVLLSPVAPLVAYALTEARTRGPESARAGYAVVLVAVAVAALIVLGSLPVAPRTPFSVVWDNRRRILARLLSIGLVALLAVATVLWIAPAIATWARMFSEADLAVWAFAAALSSVAIACVAVLAWRGGSRLRTWVKADGSSWTKMRVPHPAGSAAGWSLVYGMAYLGAAFGLAALPNRPLWLHAAIVVAVAFAVVLLLILPWLLPWRACRRITRTLIIDAKPEYYCDQNGIPAPRQLIARLPLTGSAYVYLLSDGTDGLALTRAGERLWRRIEAKLDKASAVLRQTNARQQRLPAKVRLGRRRRADSG